MHLIFLFSFLAIFNVFLFIGSFFIDAFPSFHVFFNLFSFLLNSPFRYFFINIYIFKISENPNQFINTHEGHGVCSVSDLRQDFWPQSRFHGFINNNDTKSSRF